MGSTDEYTDDYVVELLKRDAKATSSAAHNLGLGSLSSSSSKSRDVNAPKPNTRFLKNLIRDTDTHNAALLAKEAEESRLRLKKLRDESRPAKGRPERQIYSARGRHDGTSGPPVKRRRLSDGGATRDGHGSSTRDRHHRLTSDTASSTRDHRSERKEPGLRKEHESRRELDSRRDDDSRKDDELKRSRREHRPRDERKRRRSPSSASPDEDAHRQESNRRREKEKHTTRSSQSPGRDHHQHRHRHSTHGHRSTSTTRHHDRRPQRSRHSHSPEDPDRRKRSDRDNKDRKKEGQEKARERGQSPPSDSDPLEDLIGPAPPPAQAPLRAKGRGAFNRSAIDTHFSETYDPSADVTPEVEDRDDWDQALEALRDRQKWQRQGADRLRAAGFSEREIDKWQRQKVDANGDRVPDEADVKWNKRGESREWDRGKVLGGGDDDDAGVFDVRPEWGRLKGT